MRMVRVLLPVVIAIVSAVALSAPANAEDAAAPSAVVAAAPVAVEEPAAATKAKPKASSRCKRLGFSVNDYGKVGPAADAKKGLDAYAAKWAAERNIKKYQLGKKTVTCKLYIDVGFFDEYTCDAQANICY